MLCLCNVQLWNKLKSELDPWVIDIKVKSQPHKMKDRKKRLKLYSGVSPQVEC